jgi:signal transduction histidine kinase
MPRPSHNSSRAWFEWLEEFIRLIAPPAGSLEVCDQGLGRIAAMTGARAGVFLPAGAAAPDEPVASWGDAPRDDLVRAGVAALHAARDASAADAPTGRRRRAAGPGTGSAGGGPHVLLVPHQGEPLGAVVLDVSSLPTGEARRFLLLALGAFAAALRAARSLEAARRQGELLARRNLELKTLRQLGAGLQDAGSERAILQAALEQILSMLGLPAGWIFWGEETRGRLDLAASHGVVPEFVRQAETGCLTPCLCQDVFDTGRLRVARNTTECPRLPDLLGPNGPQHHACVPLKFERGVLGVLNIAGRPGSTFSTDELRFFETVGTQICLAVDKARTAGAEARRNAEARALVALAAAIGGSLEEKQVLSAVGDYVRGLVGCDRCAIFLGDTPASLSLAYLSGPPLQGFEPGQTADAAALGSVALPEALRARRTMVIDDAARDSRSNAELALRWGIGSSVLVPLESHGRLVGLVHATRAARAPFTVEEVALIEALSGQVAVAIENARLYHEARRLFVSLQEAQDGMMKAERLAAIGTLASSLAHEVRNPLNSINLILVLLSRRLARLQDSGEPAAMVEDVRREIDRLNRLVEEFLSLSSLDRLTRHESDPAAVVRDMLALMTPLAASRGIAVREDLPAALPRLLLDRQKIQQALINLVRNAIEAMAQGGTLTVSARAADGGVVLEVRDTGCGIEPGLDVFDFFISNKRGGTGLGLPISRRIVEAHGGRLTFESAPGRGTTFRIALKAEARSVAPPAGAS